MNTYSKFRLGVRFDVTEKARYATCVALAAAILATMLLLALTYGPTWMPINDPGVARFAAVVAVVIPAGIALLVSLTNSEGENRIANAVLSPFFFGAMAGIMADDATNDQSLAWVAVTIVAACAALLGAAAGELLRHRR